jgi:hypothetical protein
MNDAMLEFAIGGAKVKRAAIAKFGAGELRRVEESRQLRLPRIDDAPKPRYKTEGDTAKPIDTENTKFVGPGLRRIDGTWKMAMELPPGTDETMVRRQTEATRKQAKAFTDIAAGVESGKYPDADALADALDAANKAAQPPP